MPLANGEPAPRLTLPATPSGEPFTLPVGEKNIAIFFFPAAGTTGCTKEACAFRDFQNDNATFKRHSEDLVVVGVSGDTITKQLKFVDDNGLGYPILSDASGEARKAFGVKKAFMGMVEGRETFFIGKDGKVKDVCTSGINFSAHAKMIEKQLKLAEGAGGKA